MHEPSVRTSRFAIAGGLLAVIALGGAGFFLGRSSAPTPPAPQSAPVVMPQPVPTSTPEPEAPRTLGRADIIALANSASDALASGDTLPDAANSAVGKRFDMLLPFGCEGPAAEDSNQPLRWRYDDENATLRVHVAPSVWKASDWDFEADAGVDAIEGFWVARPWSLGGACPVRSGRAAATGFEPVTLPGQTLAVAQFFAGNGRREALRDGRPYQIVKRIPNAEFDGSKGFRLHLTGRIATIPGGGPVRCIQPAGVEQRPICVVAVALEEVRIENPIDGAVLATWPIRSSARTEN